MTNIIKTAQTRNFVLENIFYQNTLTLIVTPEHFVSIGSHYSDVLTKYYIQINTHFNSYLIKNIIILHNFRIFIEINTYTLAAVFKTCIALSVLPVASNQRGLSGKNQ